MKVNNTYEEGTQIKCYKYGSLIGFQKDTILKIENIE